MMGILILGLPTAAWAGDLESDVTEAREFEAFKVYFAGMRVEDRDLTEIDRSGRARGTRWSFFYDCDPSDENCELAAEIQDVSICERHPSMYPSYPNLTGFRGAKAAWIPTAGGFEVYTHQTTITVFADRRAEAEAIARQLRSVRRETRPDHLSAPSQEALEGKLGCQR